MQSIWFSESKISITLLFPFWNWIIPVSSFITVCSGNAWLICNTYHNIAPPRSWLRRRASAFAFQQLCIHLLAVKHKMTYKLNCTKLRTWGQLDKRETTFWLHYWKVKRECTKPSKLHGNDCFVFYLLHVRFISLQKPSSNPGSALDTARHFRCLTFS